jgi:AcrR family transcriptional regulator
MIMRFDLEVKYNVYGIIEPEGSPAVDTGPEVAPARRLQPRKREAIVRAARRVFATEGYTRASVESIAAEADVSTRTIYNHFASKEALFGSVLVESATEVAESVTRAVARAVTEHPDLRDLLVAIGYALVDQGRDFPEHFAMVRQMGAEETHHPAAIIRAWQRAGPLRVRDEVARCLHDLGERGLLRVADPIRATLHLIALTSGQLAIRPDPYLAKTRISAEEAEEIVTTGVDAFLYGYAAGRAP